MSTVSVSAQDTHTPLSKVGKVTDSVSEVMPPEKKRKIDPEFAASVESKLSEIRKDLEKLDKFKSEGKNVTPQNKRKNKKKNQQNNAVKTSTTSESNEFDYTNVDFKKFGGGSIKQQSNVQIKTKFHGKV